MLTMFNAYTNEIDDPDVAAAEITEQLKDKKLLKNSVGIIACYFEFIETGVVEAICKTLPFDVIGCSVMGSAVNAAGSMEQLSLTILTGDDVTFSTAFSDIISKDNFDAPVEKVFTEAKNRLGNDPSLVFVLGPIMGDVSGTQMLKKLDQLSGKTPIFGTLSNDTSLGYQKSYVFSNRTGGAETALESHLSKMALLLLHGDINPRFFTMSISKRNIQQQNAIVTDSDGYLVKKINDLSLTDYFMTIGIRTSELAAVTMLPFLVNFGDGTEPVAYSMYAISEKGALCGGEIPVGSAITFAEVDYRSVMDTAELAVQTVIADAEKNGINGVIAIPCFTRSLVISPNTEDEIEKSLELVGNKFPFSFIYSGGEICPVYNEQKETINRFHNLTYTVMVF